MSFFGFVEDEDGALDFVDDGLAVVVGLVDVGFEEALVGVFEDVLLGGVLLADAVGDAEEVGGALVVGFGEDGFVSVGFGGAGASLLGASPPASLINCSIEPLNESWSPGLLPESEYCQIV
jgi:hypothetical protein